MLDFVCDLHEKKFSIFDQPIYILTFWNNLIKSLGF